jgi:hypothetical protein
MNTPHLSPAAQAFLQQQDSFARFRRALRLADQLALDDLFAAAAEHSDAANLVTHATAYETMLLCMLLEEKKEVARLKTLVEAALAGTTP